jgi:hypothetical protein
MLERFKRFTLEEDEKHPETGKETCLNEDHGEGINPRAELGLSFLEDTTSLNIGRVPRNSLH